MNAYTTMVIELGEIIVNIFAAVQSGELQQCDADQLVFDIWEHANERVFS